MCSARNGGLSWDSNASSWDMTTAMSFPVGRHFFVENGVLMLTVAKAILKDGSEGILEHPVRFCPFSASRCRPALKAPGPGAIGKQRQTAAPRNFNRAESRHVRFPKRWGNRPASLWIAEN